MENGRLSRRDAAILASAALAVAATEIAVSSYAVNPYPTPVLSPTPEPTPAQVAAQPTLVPTQIPSPTLAPTATPSPESHPDSQKDRLKTILNSTMGGDAKSERSIFFDSTLTDEERRAVFSVMQNKTIRLEARNRLWQDRISKASQEGLIINSELEKICTELGIHPEVMATAWEVQKELAKTGEESTNSSYRQLLPSFQVPTLFLAMIAQAETTGGIDFGNSFYKNVFTRDQITRFTKYLSNVKPYGLAIQWNINSLYASSNGYVGIPQIASNTLPLLMPDTDKKSGNKVHKEDGSYLNIYDLFEGILAVNWLLIHPEKGWNNNSKNACLRAWNGYGTNANFEKLWNKNFAVNQMPLFIPKALAS